MTSNYIYLLQEREFIRMNEQVYKVGRTAQENHKRFSQYPNGSVLLFQMICYDCKDIERKVLCQFREKFKHRKDIGNEYFEGDYKMMSDVIYTTIKAETCTSGDVNKVSDDEDDAETQKFNTLYENMCKKISETFPNYKHDESFGGNKKYIKIVPGHGYPYAILYINEDLADMVKKKKVPCDSVIIPEHDINCYVGDELLYFKNLIVRNVVSLNKIYDINSDKIVNAISKTKIKIDIENYEEIKSSYLQNVLRERKIVPAVNIEEKIRCLFNCNMIVNNQWHATLIMEDYSIYKNFNKHSDFTLLKIDIGTYSYIIISIVKINSKFYELNFLRKYIPYVLDWDKGGNVCLVNRAYECINMDTKDRKYEGHTYLFDDGCQPWDSTENFIKMNDKYKQIVKEKSLVNCINSNKYTDELMSIYSH